MRERQLNKEHRYFFRADFHGVGKFLVGLSRMYPKDEIDDRVWTTVRDFTKEHEALDLPDPYGAFEFARSVGMVDFRTFRQIRRTSAVWEVIADNCIIAETLCTPGAEIEQKTLPDMRLGRPVQEPLF